MEIRMLQQPELLPALHLVWEVFADETAPSLTPEGVASFQKYIRYDYINQIWQRGNLLFFGAYNEGELCGTLALRPDGHIALFFVKKQWQNKGVGRMLFQSAYYLCAGQLRVNKMTVNAAPGAVDKYVHMGMHIAGEEREADGLRFVPMEMFLNPGMAAKKSKAPWIALGAFGMVMLLILVVSAVVIMKDIRAESENRRREYADSYGSEFWNDYAAPEGDGQPGGTDDYSEEITGIYAIPEDIAENLPYEIEEDEYVYSGEDMSSTMIEFNVSYPKITGLADSAVEKKVNDRLRAAAKETVVQIYEDPSPEIKERVLGESNPMLINYVEYKVCFATENFISVAFDDSAFEGGQGYYAQHLRTCNISLKDGTVYKVEDIVKLNDDFIEDWIQTMRKEADNDSFLSELDRNDMKKALGGDSMDGVYVDNFFLCENGIEIGFDLNYEADDPDNLGYAWVTAPFTWEEIEEYAANSDFWKYIRK